MIRRLFSCIGFSNLKSKKRCFLYFYYRIINWEEGKSFRMKESKYYIIINFCFCHSKYKDHYFYKGICISWPPAPGPGPKFVFTGPGPQFVFTSPGTKFVFTGPGPQFVFTGPGPQFVFTGPGPKFVFTGPGPQFVFTGPGLWFVRTQAAKLIYPQWCWII